jgi:YidC/Oxa1 family membrane protein insertase
MLVQQRFMPTGNMDPTQARLMKMMPLLFGFFFFTFPSGLVIYIFFNMVLTILQQWWIKRSYAMAAPNMGVSNG